MKIEVAESLVRSWLRHCEGCQVVELNWKPSPEWSLVISKELEATFTDMQARFPQAIKKTASLGQFLRQAEIDVLGMRIAPNGKVEMVFAVDSAFHSKGLSYGNDDGTRCRVQNKLLRTALLLDAYFHGIEAQILFVSPKINPGRASLLATALMETKDFFVERSQASFFLCGPDEFRDRILMPVLKLKDSIADTSELFLRSWQLVALFISEEKTNEAPAASMIQKSKEVLKQNYNEKRNALISAYYMSKYEHENLHLGNQSETFKQMAETYRINYRTLQNYRDYFDPHTGSHRRGWHQVDIPPQFKEIHNEFMLYEEPKLREIVLQSLRKG
ncbi:hypothetical protein PCS_02347 [Desulfocurvibacter africanus PCS]|uniref:Uncharacterized protein n=1 Tax=Desulfocurvibacter africanus PCS TaxID=1262666 RepID=M5PRB5_DESAF|nr:hypothetical protein [Desulfocurvibacter africanus]EMG36927.1 hypothetical protein PCS_02347 [Desulfocurvibacter africanus PCS]